MFYTAWSRDGGELFVEFPRAKGVDEFDKIMEKMRQLFDRLLKVLSWPEYITNYGGWDFTSSVEGTSYRYVPMGNDVGAEQDVEAEDEAGNDSGTKEVASTGEVTEKKRDNDDGWQAVGANPAKSHHRAIQRTQDCRYGIRCARKGECGSKHSEKDRKLF